MSFFAGVDRELCDHTPPLLFFIVGELCWSACDACVVSLFGQSVPEVPYARSSPARTWNSAFPFLARPTRPLLPWLARWTRPLARARSRPQCRDAGCVLCTSRQYVDMIAHSPPSRSFSTLSVSFTTGPFGCIARPAVAVAGGKRSWRADW
jgi:hypothetical protein